MVKKRKQMKWSLQEKKREREKDSGRSEIKRVKVLGKNEL